MANRLDFTLEPGDQETLARISGPLDAHLRLIESRLGVAVHNRGPRFNLTGPGGAVKAAGALIHDLHRMAQEEPVSLEQVHTALQTAHVEGLAEPEGTGDDPALRLKRAVIRGRGPRQAKYLSAIARHDLSFGIGPAGTGKTYLAVAAAVAALEQDRVQRLVLVRPAVEAGERLGFLPGDLAQKIDPYLRPMYDALYELMGFDQTARLMERQVIEVAPLAYMRGRTLNEAFIILDEAQNTTLEQMKMFLTRIGFGSTAVVNGDITQVDLPRGQGSGLKHAMQILQGVEGVHITRFQAGDVVRHPLVQRIVEAYEAHDHASGKPAGESEPGSGRGADGA
ncbi:MULTISPECIES: PhoH family protein [unclassified Thioalkalivibrio]|uniref:PhoH family protein n=1 Tax=unclassified Thioalkalivibrio TaxID=2621013 RepID=UPI00036F0C06|nr:MULTISPECIES: PhoH family protein [unclassified Thioalkalivibrio]